MTVVTRTSIKVRVFGQRDPCSFLLLCTQMGFIAETTHNAMLDGSLDSVQPRLTKCVCITGQSPY
mgnify:CR=1 FL=1